MDKIKDLEVEKTNKSEKVQNSMQMKWWHCILIYCVANGISFLAAGYNGDEAFYNDFSQPSIAPPDWLFAPMWFFLNVTSLIALYTITNMPVETKNRKNIIILEYIGWILYAVFAYLYFYLQSPILGALNTIFGLIIIILVVKMSYSISKKVFWNFFPRLLWLLLATYVSTWIVLHNRDVFLNWGPFIK